MKYAINQLIKSLVNPYTTIVFILLILVTIFYKKIRGFMGEFWVKQELKKLPKKEYYILNNIMIKVNDETSQIDHIVISKFGIFVIEMKNYYGLIKGNEYNKNWQQYLGKNRYDFKNPIHQNYGHIQVLCNKLDLPIEYFKSIICFSNQTKLDIESKKTPVVYLDFISDTILKQQNEIIEMDLNEIREKILDANIIDKQGRKSHVVEIKKDIKEKDDKLKNKICPECGGNLEVKNGRYGMFMGCSNYPKCKYTHKIMQAK